MKKKLTAIALVICLMAVAVIGGSLAYFTDNEKAENVFTTGDVKIDLIEKFDKDNAKLLPGIDVEKLVTVKNTGSENAFVRVHIAVPAILDSGSEDLPQFAAYNNTLHWNFAKGTYDEGEWNWNADKNGANYPGNGGTWNFYTKDINGVTYNVYVATYENALKSGEETVSSLTKVYLDTKVTNEQLAGILEALGDEGIKVYVIAEGAQEAGFEGDAYEALNTQFGVPGKYDAFTAKIEVPAA